MENTTLENGKVPLWNVCCRRGLETALARSAQKGTAEIQPIGRWKFSVDLQCFPNTFCRRTYKMLDIIRNRGKQAEIADFVGAV